MDQHMAAIRNTKRLLRRFFLLLLLVYGCYGRRTKKKCKPVSLVDAMIAARASNAIYYKGLKVGKNVPGTSFKVRKILSPSLYGQPLKAFVATSGKTTLICFRGSTTDKQGLHLVHSAFSPLKRLYFGGRKVKMLTYYYMALLRFSPYILLPGISSDRKYVITGHSLGGALASLFSIYMKVKHGDIWTHPESSLITFGSPRIGDKNYAKMHDDLIENSRKLRFVYRHDYVPHLPWRPWYNHHSREIWIWKRGHFNWWKLKVSYKTYWTACQLGDDPPYCSSQTSYKDLESHSMSNYLTALASQPNGYYDGNAHPVGSFYEAQCDDMRENAVTTTS